MLTPALITTLGDYSQSQLGVILPHEHIFVDLGPIEARSYEAADAADVIDVMLPHVQAAQAAGVTALVECTPVGVGRRVEIVKAVSAAADFPVVVATGIYREPWVPEWAHAAAEAELTAWMLGELIDGIDGSDVRAAWIKLSAGDDGMTPIETKILRAAARASKETGAIIGSHTIRGRVVRDQLDILEEAGGNVERFIWIHTQAEPDFSLHLEVAQRGAWLEYDAIGSDAFTDDWFIEHIHRLLDAGYEEQLLLSHDRGWYDPSKPRGGTQLAYTYLTETFLPKLRASGVDDATIAQLTIQNPWQAFAR
ncbi:esterase [Caldilinea sp.]|uniref:phosphotriesterase family protein n=1 Tax=Caldilinea sp. TaxID=2293560 RepID=UPI002BE212FD|nr:esterase [Anaerolineales bacterium]HQY91278.1 esterase [Caldilinea sp.]